MNYVSPRVLSDARDAAGSRRGIRARRGADGPRVAVVNERFVEKFALGDGRRRQAHGVRHGAETLDIEIVGVVRDAKYSEVKADAPPQVFIPRAQAPLLGEMSFYLRSNLASPELRSAVMAVLARHDANLPLMNFRTVAEQARENIFLDRFMSTLATALAAMAVVLAGIGIYGVLSYGVVQRLREIGLRIALGAAPRNVRGMVLKQVGVDGGRSASRSA